MQVVLHSLFPRLPSLLLFLTMALSTEQVALLRTVGAAVSIYFNVKYVFGAAVPESYRRLFIIAVLIAAIIGVRAAK